MGEAERSLRRLPGRGGILGISDDDDAAGGFGDRAGRGGMTGAGWDMMKFWELLTSQRQPNRIPHGYAWSYAGSKQQLHTRLQ